MKISEIEGELNVLIDVLRLVDSISDQPQHRAASRFLIEKAKHLAIEVSLVAYNFDADQVLVGMLDHERRFVLGQLPAVVVDRVAAKSGRSVTSLVSPGVEFP